LDAGAIRPFRQRLGSWRPDFLIELIPDPQAPSLTMEQFCICEINARFGWNGFLHAAYGQKALIDLGAEQKGFVGAADCRVVSCNSRTAELMDENPNRLITPFASDTGWTVQLV
jgi:hypothetical protein